MSSKDPSRPSSIAFCSSRSRSGGSKIKWAPGCNFPAPILQFLFVFRGLAERKARQFLRAFEAHGVQQFGVEAESLQDRGSHLSRFHKAVDGPGRKARTGYQQHHIGIVMREAAVLGLLLEVSGIDHADVWNHDDVRRPGIAACTQMAAGTGSVGDARRVENGRYRTAIVDLAKSYGCGGAL